VSRDIFRDFARDAFGFMAPEVPASVPLRVLGLPGSSSVPGRDAIMSAFRRRCLEVHPDLQLAYDHPQLQAGAEAALGERPEIRELVWARDVLMEMAPLPANERPPCRPPWLDDVNRRLDAKEAARKAQKPAERTCWKCERPMAERERWRYSGRRKGWCWRCCTADDAERRRERLWLKRVNRVCRTCARRFTPTRADGRYCSPKCRQAAYRARVTGKSGNGAAQSLPVTVREVA
jgi:hypothetical protein